MQLRDHSSPCEHGWHVNHAIIPPDHLGWEDDRTLQQCFGGREVTINYEAVMAMFEQYTIAIGGGVFDLQALERNARRVVDAALGVTE